MEGSNLLGFNAISSIFTTTLVVHLHYFTVCFIPYVYVQHIIITETNIHWKFSVLFSKSHDILRSFCFVLSQMRCFGFVDVSHFFVSLLFFCSEQPLNPYPSSKHLNHFSTYEWYEGYCIIQQFHNSAMPI